MHTEHAALGLGLPAGGIVFSARTVIVSLAAGLAVTIVAAVSPARVSPARKAAKVPPVAAMQDVTVGSTGYGSKQRVIVGIAILARGVAALFTGLFGHVASAVLMVGAGVLLVYGDSVPAAPSPRYFLGTAAYDANFSARYDSQLRGTIRWESVIIALQGTVLGLLIGVFFGWALVAALKNPAPAGLRPQPRPNWCFSARASLGTGGHAIEQAASLCHPGFGRVARVPGGCRASTQTWPSWRVGLARQHIGPWRADRRCAAPGSGRRVRRRSGGGHMMFSPRGEEAGGFLSASTGALGWWPRRRSRSCLPISRVLPRCRNG